MAALNVVFTIDKKFIQHFAVTLISLLENNRDLTVRAFLIHDISDQEDLRILDGLSEMVAERYGAAVETIFFNNALFDNYKVAPNYSKTVYYRLMITDLMPADVDKVLFLDSDIVVTGSLKELARLEFKYLAAVHDVSLDNNKERLNELGFPVKEYFNAGVLLIDVKSWREENIAAKLIELADEYINRIAWQDQDILNMFFYDKWHVLSRKYNALLVMEKLPEMPVIIHYGGTHKPWLYAHDHPYKSQYWKYIKFTPFKDAKYPDYCFKEFIRKFYIRFLDLFHLRDNIERQLSEKSPHIKRVSV